MSGLPPSHNFLFCLTDHDLMLVLTQPGIQISHVYRVTAAMSANPVPLQVWDTIPGPGLAWEVFLRTLSDGIWLFACSQCTTVCDATSCYSALVSLVLTHRKVLRKGIVHPSLYDIKLWMLKIVKKTNSFWRWTGTQNVIEATEENSAWPERCGLLK